MTISLAIMKTHPVWKQPNCYYYGVDDGDADYGMMFQPQLINWKQKINKTKLPLNFTPKK